MMWRTLLLGMVSISIAFSTGCNRSGHHVREQHIPDSARARLNGGPTLPRLNVVPSRGGCAPKADNLVVFGACCNSLTCNGQCVKDDTGLIGCACFEVKGGCHDDKVCSKIRRGCVKPRDAQLP